MKDKSFQIEKVFVCIMLTIGILLIFVIPPMASPDENTHFYNAYAFSEFDFFPEYEVQNHNGKEQVSELGRRQPKAIVEYVEYYNQEFARKLNTKYRFEAMYQEGFAAVDMKEIVFHSYWNSDVNLLGYFFSGTGMFIWNIISAVIPFAAKTPYNLLIAGRLSNLFFYLCIVYYAIKITPILKKTMFLIAAMPMSVFLAASLSYDAIVIPVCFLLFAYTSNLIVKERNIKWYDVVIICGITIFLFAIKQVYIGLLLILFAVPISSFQNKKNYRKIIGIVLSAGLIAFLGYYIGLHLLTKDFTGVWSTVQNEQTKVILSHPMIFIKTILNSFKKYGDFYFISFLGNLGQLDTNFPAIVLVFYFTVLLVTALFDAGNIQQQIIRKKMKILSIAGVFFAIYTSFAGTYILWTGMIQGVGVDFVDGIQGRYFIPISIYIVLLFANDKVRKFQFYPYIEKFLQGIAVWSGCMINVIMFFLLLLRFWV